jgi:hypothetical protein
MPTVTRFRIPIYVSYYTGSKEASVYWQIELKGCLAPAWLPHVRARINHGVTSPVPCLSPRSAAATQSATARADGADGRAAALEAQLDGARRDATARHAET